MTSVPLRPLETPRIDPAPWPRVWRALVWLSLAFSWGVVVAFLYGGLVGAPFAAMLLPALIEAGRRGLPAPWRPVVRRYRSARGRG